MKNRLFALFLAIALMFPYSAFAADNFPASDSAGVEQDRFETYQEVGATIRQLREEAEQENLEEDNLGEDTPDAKKFVLKSIRFSGNESISSEELHQVTNSMIGQEVSFSELSKIANKIKKEYRSRGFIAVYVYLPPQDVTNGSVEFAVVEGTLGEVTITGNKWFSSNIIRKALGLTAGNVIFFRDLQNGLEYLNKQQDIKAKGVLKPGSASKTTDLELQVQDRFPLHLNADVSNTGTNNTGKNRFGVGLKHSNLFGQMDDLSGRFQIGRGAIGVGTRYVYPLRPNGTTLGFSYSYSRVDLQREFRDLDAEGNAHVYGFDINQPVYQSPWFKAALNTGFDFKSIENRILGRKAGKDELRILNLAANLEFQDKWGRTYFPHSFHFGFSSFLGASDKNESAAVRTNTGGQFFIYRAALLRAQKLPKGMTYIFRSSLQLTPDRLPPSEQLQLGGTYSVRGYQESDYLADNGGFINNDILIPTYFFPQDWKLPYSSLPLREQIQGVGFFDFGAGQIRNQIGTEDKKRALMGAGGGVRIHLFDRVFTRLQWAHTIGEDAADGSNGAFYYGVSAEIP